MSSFVFSIRMNYCCNISNFLWQAFSSNFQEMERQKPLKGPLVLKVSNLSGSSSICSCQKTHRTWKSSCQLESKVPTCPRASWVNGSFNSSQPLPSLTRKWILHSNNAAKGEQACLTCWTSSFSKSQLWEKMEEMIKLFRFSLLRQKPARRLRQPDRCLIRPSSWAGFWMAREVWPCHAPFHSYLQNWTFWQEKKVKRTLPRFDNHCLSPALNFYGKPRPRALNTRKLSKNVVKMNILQS